MDIFKNIKRIIWTRHIIDNLKFFRCNLNRKTNDLQRACQWVLVELFLFVRDRFLTCTFIFSVIFCLKENIQASWYFYFQFLKIICYYELCISMIKLWFWFIERSHRKISQDVLTLHFILQSLWEPSWLKWTSSQTLDLFFDALRISDESNQIFWEIINWVLHTDIDIFT